MHLLEQQMHISVDISTCTTLIFGRLRLPLLMISGLMDSCEMLGLGHDKNASLVEWEAGSVDDE